MLFQHRTTIQVTAACALSPLEGATDIPGATKLPSWTLLLSGPPFLPSSIITFKMQTFQATVQSMLFCNVKKIINPLVVGLQKNNKATNVTANIDVIVDAWTGLLSVYLLHIINTYISLVFI